MSAPIVYSWGYLGRSLSELVALADRLGAVVIDTRYVPHSRQAEWNRPHLVRVLGDRYRHVKGFGNRRYREVATDAVELVDAEAGLRAIEPILARQPVLLLCLEREHGACHRSIVADAISERFGARIIPLAQPTEERSAEEPGEAQIRLL